MTTNSTPRGGRSRPREDSAGDRRLPSNDSLMQKMGELDRDLRELWDETGTQTHDIGEIKSDVRMLAGEVANLKGLVEKLVTRHEFNPVRLLAYGMAAAMLSGVGGAILSKILVGGK